ncbi:unnamed protein product [Calypogeia fissa]
MTSPKPDDEPTASETMPSLNGIISNIGVISDRLQRADLKTPPERYLFPAEVTATNSTNSNKSSDTVPVIDLSCLKMEPANGGDHDFVPKEKVVEQMGMAAAEWGCFQVVNHGIPTELLERMDTQTRKFFALPVDVKELGQAPSRLESGYDGKFENSKVGVPWMETLLLIHRPSAEADSFTNKIWKDGNALFCNTMHEYGKAVDALHQQILELLAESLGLPETNFFSKHFHESTDAYGILKLNYYPVSPDPSRTLGMAPHIDPGILTLLSQDRVRGLQIKQRAGWVDVPPVDGAIVVTVGDCLQIWSNDEFRSVEHRAVVNDHSARLAMSYFTTTPLSLVLEAPQHVVDEKHPSHFKLETTSGEYLGAFSQLAEAADRGVSSNGRLLDSFRTEVQKF